jgi:hypothetical protein
MRSDPGRSGWLSGTGAVCVEHGGRLRDWTHEALPLHVAGRGSGAHPASRTTPVRPPPRTNDPREFAPVWFRIAGPVGDDEELTTRSPFEPIEEAGELLRGSVHVVCVTEDRPSRDGPQHGYGSGPRRARMWCRPTRLCGESTSPNALASAGRWRMRQQTAVAADLCDSLASTQQWRLPPAGAAPGRPQACGPQPPKSDAHKQ